MARDSAAQMGARSRLLTYVLATVLATSIALGLSAPANAASVNCAWPRCTVYLNKSETNSYAYQGTMPQPPSGGPISAVWYIAGLTLRWFAIQYANQGSASAST